MNILKRILFNQDGYIGKNRKEAWARGDFSNPGKHTETTSKAPETTEHVQAPNKLVGAAVGDAFEPGTSFDNANKFVMEHLAGLAGNGTASMSALQEAKINDRSGIIKNAFADRTGDEDDLPVGPGNTYLSHLFQYNGVGKKLKEMKKGLKGVNIYTDQQEALMTALSVVGVYSDKNAGGMPIDMQEAIKLKFGDGEIDETDKAQFMTMVEQGDTKIDPKRIRKFVNYDGSLTWEILNEDKTVMSRFTMGKYKGASIFAQGGYKKFAELLKTAKQKLGKDSGGEFDSIRSMFGD